MTSELEVSCEQDRSFRSKAMDAILRAGPAAAPHRAERVRREQRAAEAQSAAKDSYELCALVTGMLALKQRESGRFPARSKDAIERLDQEVRWLRADERFATIDRMVMNSVKAIERREL